MSEYVGSERQTANEVSRNTAEHHREAWSQTELEVLSLWDHTEETLADLAELLGRTIEACRQRYYEAAADGFTTRATRARSATRTVRVTTTIKWEDDDEYPDYYVRG
jgi:hypothetical protein